MSTSFVELLYDRIAKKHGHVCAARNASIYNNMITPKIFKFELFGLPKVDHLNVGFDGIDIDAPGAEILIAKLLDEQIIHRAIRKHGISVSVEKIERNCKKFGGLVVVGENWIWKRIVGECEIIRLGFLGRNTIIFSNQHKKLDITVMVGSFFTQFIKLTGAHVELNRFELKRTWGLLSTESPGGIFLIH